MINISLVDPSQGQDSLHSVDVLRAILEKVPQAEVHLVQAHVAIKHQAHTGDLSTHRA
jgi:hypothetical protein